MVKKVKKIMVIGAGWTGSMLVKKLKEEKEDFYKICCIIDDDPLKKGTYVEGVQVIGNRNYILEAVKIYNIAEIIIALPSAKKKEIRKIFDVCKKTNCKVKVVPNLYEIMVQDVEITRIRNVDIEDLLGRNPIEINNDLIYRYIKNSIVVITGGGGSIGSELARQIAVNAPKKLLIIDIYENGAYELQQELSRKYPQLDLEILIASVRDEEHITRIFEKYKPDIVFHAAAHKHVPLMEGSPCEAIKNNVFGTLNVATAAMKTDVKKFVLISTDKAVNPTNIMGASKRICEMIVQMLNAESVETDFVAVRFGNVLGSNGSVVPLFKKQLAEGGPITITHPDVVRYFMTIQEAVSLVLQAVAYADGGEIFVLDMGEPIKIYDLAKNLIRLSGFDTDEIQIEFVGLRPGEKLYEELLMEEEGIKSTDNELIYIGKPIDINVDEFKKNLKKLKLIADADGKEIRQIVKEIVPTYKF